MHSQLAADVSRKIIRLSSRAPRLRPLLARALLLSALLTLGLSCRRQIEGDDEPVTPGRPVAVQGQAATQPSNIALFNEPTPSVAVAACEGEAPMQLTGSDGSGLQLAVLDAKSVLDGPLALTELRLTFHNPQPRQREGRFQITLPTGAAISRFAMRSGNQWQEGEIVEKKQAERIYEDYLHRRQDPAILQQEAGNVFQARVFPIEASADKELIVSYSQ